MIASVALEALAVYCADVGSIRSGNFGWARMDVPERAVTRERGGDVIEDLVDAAAGDIADGVPVALGFECPLFVPVPEDPQRLGGARVGEGNRPWSAGAGAGALATGLAQAAWVLRRLRVRAPSERAFLDWENFAEARRGLFLWEAFVTDKAKATTHVDDAYVAVRCFADSLPNPARANAIDESVVLSLVGSCLAWSGWVDNGSDVLGVPCLVLRARADAG